MHPVLLEQDVNLVSAHLSVPVQTVQLEILIMVDAEQQLNVNMMRIVPKEQCVDEMVKNQNALVIFCEILNYK